MKGREKDKQTGGVKSKVPTNAHVRKNQRMLKAVYTHAPVGRAAVMRQHCPPFRTDIRLTPSGRASRNASSDYDRARSCGKKRDEGNCRRRPLAYRFSHLVFRTLAFPLSTHFLYLLLFFVLFRCDFTRGAALLNGSRSAAPTDGSGRIQFFGCALSGARAHTHTYTRCALLDIWRARWRPILRSIKPVQCSRSWGCACRGSD